MVCCFSKISGELVILLRETCSKGFYSFHRMTAYFFNHLKLCLGLWNVHKLVGSCSHLAYRRYKQLFTSFILFLSIGCNVKHTSTYVSRYYNYDNIFEQVHFYKSVFWFTASTTVKVYCHLKIINHQQLLANHIWALESWLN